MAPCQRGIDRGVGREGYKIFPLMDFLGRGIERLFCGGCGSRRCRRDILEDSKGGTRAPRSGVTFYRHFRCFRAMAAHLHRGIPSD